MSSCFAADIQGQSTVLTAKRGRVKRRRSIDNPSEQTAAETINLEPSMISYSSADDIELNVQKFCDDNLTEIPEGTVTTDVQQLQSPHRQKFTNKNKCVVVLEERILPSNEAIKKRNRQVVSTLQYAIYDGPINENENTLLRHYLFMVLQIVF